MKSTPYALGRSFEYRVKDDFEKHGYFVVRAGQSRGEADLVALRDGGKPVLVQCKRGGVISAREWNDLYALAERFGAIAVVASMPGRVGIAYERLLGPRDRRGSHPSGVFDLASQRIVVKGSVEDRN